MTARACCVVLLLSGCRLVDNLTPPSELISGMVVDAAGRPVAGAHLLANRPHEFGKPYVQLFAAKSRADGTFRIFHNAPGGPKPTGHLMMAVSRDGLPPVEQLVAIPTTGLKVVLGGSARLEVHATAVDGSPVAGRVTLHSTTPQHGVRTPEPDRRTNANGLLNIEGVPPGDYVVVVSAPGVRKVVMADGDGQAEYAFETPEIDVGRATVTVTAGATAVPVAVKFAKSPLTLTGKVVDQAGSPIAGAAVVGDGQVFRRVATSAADGTFTLDDMPEKHQVLMQGYKPGYSDPARDTLSPHTAGETNVVVVLTKK